MDKTSMTQRSVGPPAGSGVRSRLPLPAGTMAGVAIALLAVALIALFTYRSLETREDAVLRFTHTLEVMAQLESLQSSLKDAETGQRGFLLTGSDLRRDNPPAGWPLQRPRFGPPPKEVDTSAG